jgi:hypothetical protein
VLRIDGNTLELQPIGGTLTEKGTFTKNLVLSVTNPFYSNAPRISVDGINRDKGASLAVYNIRGEKIKDLTSLMNAGVKNGRADIVWSTNNLSSEVYFIRLVTGEKRLSLKLPVIR